MLFETRETDKSKRKMKPRVKGMKDGKSSASKRRPRRRRRKRKRETIAKKKIVKKSHLWKKEASKRVKRRMKMSRKLTPMKTARRDLMMKNHLKIPPRKARLLKRRSVAGLQAYLAESRTTTTLTMTTTVKIVGEKLVQLQLVEPPRVGPQRTDGKRNEANLTHQMKIATMIDLMTKMATATKRPMMRSTCSQQLRKVTMKMMTQKSLITSTTSPMLKLARTLQHRRQESLRGLKPPARDQRNEREVARLRLMAPMESRYQMKKSKREVAKRFAAS
mmetsp:Transcript_18599/g.38428  ORF Transcript_18599/g.38428 Transcript_18599/m.38428 type:complete len:276 (+) Transcript_18599:102-929(+)